VHRCAGAELDLAPCEVVEDLAGVGQERASRSSLMTTSVSPSRHAECLAQAATIAGGAGLAVVDVDSFGFHTEGGQRVALGGRVCSSVDTRA